jgi:Ser/Thr protein kinase RdoA (MazF antagonist)
MSDIELTTALDALERYDLDLASCEPLAVSYNTFFQVEASDGSRFALRISPARRIHRSGSDAAEADWLDALAEDGVVSAPRFVRTTDGAAGVDVSERRCALMTWVEGHRLADEPTRNGVRAMGAIAARLHAHAGLSSRPPGVPAFDRVVYWELDLRFDELSPVQRSVVDPALDRAQAVLDALWSDPSNASTLLHGDIGTSNVLLADGAVAVLDFEDLIWGMPALDLSISVADLRRHHGDPALEVAFREGYETERPWPTIDGTSFEALVAARWLHQIDLGLNVRKPGLETYIEDLVARIAALGS